VSLKIEAIVAKFKNKVEKPQLEDFAKTKSNQMQNYRKTSRRRRKPEKRAKQIEKKFTVLKN